MFWVSLCCLHPATNKWLLLPDNLRSCGEAHLGFDPIVSSHFHVFEYGKIREGESIGVSIYLSKSATWIFKESEWGDGYRHGILSRAEDTRASRKGPLDGAGDLPSFSARVVDPAHSS